MKAFLTFFLTVLACVVAGNSIAESRTIANAGEEDRLQIQAIISAQLKAFNSRDAERAFSYASPSLRAEDRTPDHFLAMVRKFWPEVYTARGSEFLQLAEVKGVWIQGVIISDDLGETWLAQYPMELQPDGHWLIDGCVVRSLEDRIL